MSEIVLKCTHCGSEEIEYTQQSIHRKATCKKCNKFIKFVSQSEPFIYFGKFSGCRVSEIDDKDYLVWLIEKSNIKISNKLFENIKQRISQL